MSGSVSTTQWNESVNVRILFFPIAILFIYAIVFLINILLNIESRRSLLFNYRTFMKLKMSSSNSNHPGCKNSSPVFIGGWPNFYLWPDIILTWLLANYIWKRWRVDLVDFCILRNPVLFKRDDTDEANSCCSVKVDPLTVLILLL